MRVVFTLGRRAIDVTVLLLAVYALAVVPLGRRTGLEHLRAILHTRAARDAGRELEHAAERLGQRLLGGSEPAPRGKPEVPVIPRRMPRNSVVTPATGEGPDASMETEVH